jgi:dUTP pyrophosphatase
MQLRIERIDKDVPLPSFSYAHDAGLDLCTVKEVRIAPMERVQVHTGLRIAIPEGCVGLVWDKSGRSQKEGLKVLGGVIDAGYRGEWLVGLVNLSDTEVVLEKYAKVAQVLVQRVLQPGIVEVHDLHTEKTERGERGFGSSGK